MIVRNTEILLELSQGVLDARGYGKLFDAVYGVTAHRLRFTRMNIISIDEDEGHWSRVARRNQSGHSVGGMFDRGPLTDQIRALALSDVGRARIVADYLKDAAAAGLPDYAAEGLRSGVHTFVRVPGRLVGMFSVQHEEPGQYSEGDAEFIFEVGQTLAGALEHIGDFAESTEDPESAAADKARAGRPTAVSVPEDGIIGASPRMHRLRELIARVAPTDTTVLLLGETGTGKALAAQALHNGSARAHKPFITVNCAGLAPELVSSELFGHEAGAFTGATKTHKGRFEIANGGTLFLDEIGDIVLETQVRLLRVLEEGEFERVGGSRSLKTDVRIVAATHRNLEEMEAGGLFRADLRHRLNVFPIHLPALRERGEDIIELATFFAQRAAKIAKRPLPILSDEVQRALRRYPWRGNVRELRNVIERAMILSDAATIELRQMPLEVAHADTRTMIRRTVSEFGVAPPRPAGGSAAVMTSNVSDDSPMATLSDAIRTHILKALTLCNGKISGVGGAAELLEIKPKTLESKMRKLGIRREWR